MNAQVSVVMGSISDWLTMKLTGEILDKLNVPYEKQWFPLTGCRLN